MLKDLSIYQIESLTEDETKANAEEMQVIKEYSCYFIDLPPYFKHSVLIYKNNRQIKYANLYELHYPTMNGNKEELKKMYIKTLNDTLFTKEEIESPIMTMFEEKNKEYFIRNLYQLQYDCINILYIGEKQKKEIEEKVESGYTYGTYRTYNAFKSEEDRDDVVKTFDTFMEKKKEFKKRSGIEYFKEHIRYELFNHEYGVTMDYTEALEALGLKYNNLTKKEKGVLKAECDYVLANTY